MKKDLIDFDPLSRIATYHYYNPDTDETTIEEVQDCTPFLERAKKLRNLDGYSQHGIKEEMWHYCTIPNIVITQLMRRGIDVYNKEQSKEVIRIINTEYPWLKTTHGHHA